ncbi:MAG TPA: hypothetical protein VFF12_15085, partial [Myxococcaceae bacterium]|nr:hypothetical protein [Myxococcaceae bacterium]
MSSKLLPSLSRYAVQSMGAATPGHWTELEGRIRTQLERGDRDQAATQVIERLEPDIRGYIGCRLVGDD